MAGPGGVVCWHGAACRETHSGLAGKASLGMSLGKKKHSESLHISLYCQPGSYRPLLPSWLTCAHLHHSILIPATMVHLTACLLHHPYSYKRLGSELWKNLGELRAGLFSGTSFARALAAGLSAAPSGGQIDCECGDSQQHHKFANSLYPKVLHRLSTPPKYCIQHQDKKQQPKSKWFATEKQGKELPLNHRLHFYCPKIVEYFLLTSKLKYVFIQMQCSQSQ